ncbi:CAF17-like 4Fe-4S cluster assembly/insertion protein YgfZ [Rhizobium sp. GN54]|uniref:CAF17-like 4Fe-4S cluster assembly/insertion protein YgfZ n=1 Tax=Rhizobium sp. GN54 TaxID=2898150 RepID=UPI001E48F574|nr:folate-binding protein YgfZ [Rhizobium sp. GN54]MCD2181104.1 folate-binding protein YgfZ [Rhizobium sp. GN54]
MPATTLSGRAFVTITGPDAEDFLQGLITTDLAALPQREARAGALLTPQGKILFDFLVFRLPGGGLCLETTGSQSDALVKRLTMYKLRAQVTIATTGETEATVSWDGEGDDDGEAITDDRFARAGRKVLRRPGGGGNAAASVYDALRVDCGIVESGADYALSDAFPHDVLLDLSGGLSFRKGCYVGQEVVSRMQHRSTARRRPVIVQARAALPPSGTEIVAEGKTIGTLGTVAGERGLAIVRIDRVAEAQRAGAPILAGAVEVTVRLPEWTGLSFPEESAGAPAQ